MPAAVLGISQVTKRGGPRPVPARRANAHDETATAAAAIVSENVGWEAATRPRRSASADRIRVYVCRILSFMGGLLDRDERLAARRIMHIRAEKSIELGAVARFEI